MKENHADQSLYQKMANELGRGWLVRRIRREARHWAIQDFQGKSSGDKLKASEITLNILKQPMFKSEIIIVICLDMLRRDTADYSVRRIYETKDVLLKYLDGMNGVGCASFCLPNCEEVLHHSKSSEVTANQWSMLFQTMSYARGCSHLLISGRNITCEVISESLSVFIDPEKNIEVYEALPKLIGSQNMVYSSYEKELMKEGFFESNMMALRAHLDSIGDSGAEKSLKKTLLNIPWQKRVYVERDLQTIRQSLDESLFGMQEAKKEVLAAIAGSLLSDSESFHPPCILLYGEAGTGKTAMAKAIAKALKMPFESVAMNGISAGPGVVGLEPCWQGSQPGKVVQSMIKSEALNPVLLLDEIDKASSNDKYTSPVNALLQVLDPVQNKLFCDLYVNIPIDASEMFFIATANDISELPEPLLDRLVVIYVPEYSVQEKQEIMPFLFKQIEQEKQLPRAFQFTARALILMEERLLPIAGLRKIKACLWRMLCESALLAKDIGEFKRKLMIDEYAVELVLDAKFIEKPVKKMGFL